MNYKTLKQTILVLLLGTLFFNSAMAEDKIKKSEPSLLELKGACQNDVASSCFLLAGRYFKGNKVTVNIVKAKKYFNKACTLGMKKSCDLTLGMDKILKETETKYSTGCDKGDISSCSSMGLLLFRGQMIAKDWVKARKYMTKACDKKDKMSCDLLKGLNIVEQYQDECSKGKGSSCLSIGALYFKGDMEGEPNADEALKFFTKACDSESADGCSFIAKMYLKGFGVRPNIQTAAKFFEKACNYGDSNICMMLGSKYEEGNRVKKDVLKAKELYKKACELGDKRGCNRGEN